MAVQAGRDPLDYELWDEDKNRYFRAIQAGLDRNYELMVELVRQSLGVQQ